MTDAPERSDDSGSTTNGRALPEPINRTTRRGGDQYVLGCSVREFADETRFANIERIERDNRALRKELAWKLSRGTKRNHRWVWSRFIIVAYMFAIAGGYAGWVFSSNGKVARVALIRGYNETSILPVRLVREENPILANIPQREIDSLVAWMATSDARRDR